MARLPEIKLNKETIGFALALVSLTTAVMGGYNWLLSGRPENSPVVHELSSTIQKAFAEQAILDQKQNQRLDRTDEDRKNNTEALKEQTQETQKLKEAVVKLTAVIEQGVVTKKAEYDPSYLSYPERTIPIGTR